VAMLGGDLADGASYRDRCRVCGLTAGSFGVRTRPMCSAARRSSAGTPSV
jgi:hypothetical protein